MEGNRYPDTCSTGLASSLYRYAWIPVTFHDFTQGVLLLLLWSYPEQQFVPVKGRLFHRAQTAVQGVTIVTGEEHLSEVMEGNRYPDTSVKTASKPCVWIPVTIP